MIETFKNEIKFRLNENLSRIEKCLNLLNEAAGRVKTK